MKLSFALKSNPSSSSTSLPQIPSNNPLIDDSDSDSSEFNQTLNPPNSNPNLIIPPLQNTWKPYLPNLNSDVQESLTTDSTNSTDSSSSSYGLNLRTKKVSLDNDSGDETLEMKLLQKLREDIKNLPEDKGLDEFVDVPVKSYGKAVLKGYGWSEGQGIGKNAKEDVKVFVREGKIGRGGLGFVPPPSN